ncbi:hypothetical protein LCGC14_0358120 [marine sediment metagenome]|uniref:Uncharacterized protein n=1 Tax=marine sediment metagenome TaxID=412755 RepID=A0A0F9VW43_9ZZZZ
MNDMKYLGIVIFSAGCVFGRDVGPISIEEAQAIKDAVKKEADVQDGYIEVTLGPNREPSVVL